MNEDMKVVDFEAGVAKLIDKYSGNLTISYPESKDQGEYPLKIASGLLEVVAEQVPDLVRKYMPYAKMVGMTSADSKVREVFLTQLRSNITIRHSNWDNYVMSQMEAYYSYVYCGGEGGMNPTLERLAEIMTTGNINIIGLNATYAQVELIHDNEIDLVMRLCDERLDSKPVDEDAIKSAIKMTYAHAYMIKVSGSYASLPADLIVSYDLAQITQLVDLIAHHKQKL